DSAMQEQGILGNEAGRVAKDLAQCEEKFRQEGGELYLLRSELDAERARLQKELAAEETALREIAAGPAPLLLIAGLLEETEKQARRESESRKSTLVVAALEERDTDLLRILKKNKLPTRQLNLIEDLLQTDRNDRADTAVDLIILNGDDH